MTVGELRDELKSCGTDDEVKVCVAPLDAGSADTELLEIGNVAIGLGRVTLDTYAGAVPVEKS